jgi:hypothetical protein
MTMVPEPTPVVRFIRRVPVWAGPALFVLGVLVFIAISSLFQATSHLFGQVVAQRDGRFCVVIEKPSERSFPILGQSGCYLLNPDSEGNRPAPGSCIDLSIDFYLNNFPYRRGNFKPVSRACNIPEIELAVFKRQMLEAASPLGYDI